MNTTLTSEALIERRSSGNPILSRVISTDNSLSAFAIRLLFGLVMFPHGGQHFAGWFGGYGFSGTIGWMTGTLGIPAAFAFLSVTLEFFGSLALIAGFGTRIFAIGFAIDMLVAATTHLQNGFFMNWVGNIKGEGFEYHLLAITIALVIAFRGAGAYSIDGLLHSKNGRV